MATSIDVSGFHEDHYFARAWHLVTQEKGWWKPILLMAVALLVPVAGPLAVLGYQLEWARLLAWDVNEPMKRSDVHIGELIASGWRGFVAMIGWAIVNALISRIFSEIPVFGDLLDLAWSICGIFISMMIMVASIRATIYQKFSAGYSFKNLWEMAKRDLGGLARVWLIWFVSMLFQGIVCIFIAVGSALSILPSMYWGLSNLVNYGYYMDNQTVAYYAFDLLATFLNGFWPALLVILAILLVVGTLTCTIVYAGLALWMRQFDIPAWGKSEDPLPASVVADEPVADEVPEVPVAPVAPVAPVTPAEPARPAEPEQPAAAPVAEATVEKEEKPIEVPIPGENPADDASEDDVVVCEPIAPARGQEDELPLDSEDDEDASEENDEDADTPDEDE